MTKWTDERSCQTKVGSSQPPHHPPHQPPQHPPQQPPHKPPQQPSHEVNRYEIVGALTLAALTGMVLWTKR